MKKNIIGNKQLLVFVAFLFIISCNVFATNDKSKSESQNISFADANVKAICVANWDTNGDGKLSESEAAAVEDLGEVFKETSITSFDELLYFTRLTKIPYRAFYRCAYLTSVTFPNSIISIEDDAFYECGALKGPLTFPKSLKTIGNYAFIRCNNITGSLTIPNSVTSIGDAAFYACTGLTGSLSIPNSVTSIGDAAFYECYSLTGSLVIPDSITSIGEGTFAYCRGLTGSLTIPISVKNIKNDAFRECKGFTGTLRVPNQVESIGLNAFYGCLGLNTIIIPNSVTSIDAYAFSNCNSVSLVISRILNPFSISNVFSSTGAVLQVPKGTKGHYEALSGWKNAFKEITEYAIDYSLTISSTGNGFVLYNGTTIKGNSSSFSVTEGDNAEIQITPDEGYRIKSVKVNGIDVTSEVTNNQYTISNITSDTTLEVEFELITYSLTIKATGNGTVTYAETTVRGKSSSFTISYGDNATISFVPDDGYRIKSVKLNDTDVTSSVKNNQYTITGIKANTTLAVVFEQIPDYTISIVSEGNGKVSFSGSIIRNQSKEFTIREGGSISISFTPDNGYRLASVKVNGENKTAQVENNQLTLENISANMTIEVAFEVIPPTTYTLTIKASGNGVATYEGTSIRGRSSSFTLVDGTYATITILPDEGYRIKCVKTDGTDVTSSVKNNSYSLKVEANSTIEVEFERITYTLTLTVEGNGSVSYNGTSVSGKSMTFTIMEGNNAVVTFTPNTGCRIKSVKLNGIDITSYIVNLQYTITNIYENTTLEVVFEAIPTYIINIVSAGNGSVKYSSVVIRNQSREFSIKEGNTINLQFFADSGYRLASVKVNNQDLIGQVVNNQLTIEGVSGDMNIEVEFEAIPVTTYQLTIKSTGYGAVTYEGTTIRNKSNVFTVAKGTNAVLVISPDDGYKIKSVKQNGTDVTSNVANYLYSTKVESNTTIEIEFMEGDREFASENVNYKVVSYNDRTVRVACGNYGTTLTVPATCTANDRQWTVIGIEANALSGNTELAAIIWNPEVAFNGSVSNPNLLLYVKDKKYGGMVKNVIVNGEADEIILTDAASGNNFYCPQTFTAKRITYEHNYSMKSGYNTCQGWETLVLPFDVSQILRQGEIELVPHNAWIVGANQRPFWLYSLTELGWKKESAIAANTPYIICMPNNENYNNKYNISGVVQFIGTNVPVKASDNLNIGMKGNKKFVPNYQNQQADATIYALNVNNQWCQNTASEVEGSVFIQSLRPVRPFEAYLTVSGSEAARRVIPIFEEGESTGIIDLPLRDDINVDTWFTLDGRKLFSKPTQKGVYLNNGKKIMVK